MSRCGHGYDYCYCPVCWVNAPGQVVVKWVTLDAISEEGK